MKRLAFIGLCSIIFGFTTPQSRQVLEAKLILTFINNTEWQKPKDKIRIGVLGNSRILTELSNRIKYDKLGYSVKRINYLDDASNCDLLVVPGGPGTDIPKLLEVIGDRNILVIAEEKKAANMNLDICFVEEEGKLRFVINETMAKKKGLKFSHRLLDFATEIY